MDPLDRRLIAAWEALPEPQRRNIEAALRAPSSIGAYINADGARCDRCVRTALGYVVHSGFVTPLAREMIEAAEFNAGAAQ